jgi:hypothetical protein
MSQIGVFDASRFKGIDTKDSMAGVSLLAQANVSSSGLSADYKSKVKTYLDHKILTPATINGKDQVGFMRGRGSMTSIDQMATQLISGNVSVQRYERLTKLLNYHVSQSTSGKITDWTQLLTPTAQGDLKKAIAFAHASPTLANMAPGKHIDLEHSLTWKDTSGRVRSADGGGVLPVQTGNRTLESLGATYIGAKKMAWGKYDDKGNLSKDTSDNIAVYRMPADLANKIIKHDLSFGAARPGFGNLGQPAVGYALRPDRRDDNMVLLYVVVGGLRADGFEIGNNPNSGRNGLVHVRERVPHLNTGATRR